MGVFVHDKDFYKSFLHLTLVIALQNVIIFAVNLADNIMLGGFSEDALSGVALVNQIQFLLQMLVMGVGEGVVILSSRAWGAKDLPAIRKLGGLGMRLALGVSVALWAIVFFLPEACLGLFADEADVIEEGVRYLLIVCFSYPFFALTNALLASLRSVETVRIGFVVNLAALFINVSLNYVLIYGHFGFPCLGAQGAAIATLVSRIIETAITVFYVLVLDKKIHLRPRSFITFDRELLKKYLHVSLPVILSNAIWGIAMAVQTAILGHLGKPSISANSIATTMFQIVSVITYGSASATSVVIGKTIGSGHVDRVRGYSRTLQVLYLIIGAFTGLILFLIKDFIIGFYDVSPESKSLAVAFMTVLSVTVVGTAYQMPCLTGLVRAGGDTHFVLFNDLIFMWLIVIPSAALSAFVFEFSPLVVFICLKSDQILKCFVAVVKVNRYRWIKTFNPEEEK